MTSRDSESNAQADSPSMQEDSSQVGNPSPPLSVGCGLLMGGADAIPGVSGGTIALILGIYERFVSALNEVVRAPMQLRSADGRARVLDALRFLVPLGIGVAIAYAVVTKLLVGKSEDPGYMIQPDSAPACYAFFFGLVIASLREPWKRIGSAGAPHFIAAILGCAAAAVFAGLPHASSAPERWMLLLGGAGAISVMILPGVSGSLLLVILGQYQAVVNALHDRDIATFAVFLGGIVLGVLLFVPTLKRLLASHHDLTMAALTGLMAGSLRALWPWKESYDIKAAQMKNTGVIDGTIMSVAIAFVLGALVVLLLTRLEARLERPSA